MIYLFTAIGGDTWWQ